MSKTVLVTGGTGFVAGWCVVELLAAGYTVRMTVRSAAKEAAVRVAVAAGLRTTLHPIAAAGSSGASGVGGPTGPTTASGPTTAGGLGVASGLTPAGELGGASAASGTSTVAERLTFWVADLTADAGWDEAVAGCDYVLHVASPLAGAFAENEATLIDAAREGTLRLLRAATRAGVERLVMTSSTAAATPPPGRAGTVGDESVWTDPADRRVNAYRRSKILAERAAWDFMAGYRGPTTLATVLPGAIFGPVLTTANLGSVALIQRLLDGRLPGTPRVGFCVVDVRDLAALHVRAMTAPAAAGERFIATGDFLWMSEIAGILRERLGARAPRRVLPDLLVRALALVTPDLRSITPLLGQKRLFSSAKAQRALGFTPRPATATVVDCAKSLPRGD